MQKLKEEQTYTTVEKERFIGIIAAAYSWLYICAFLVTWVIKELISDTTVSYTMLVLSSAMVVFFSIHIYLSRSKKSANNITELHPFLIFILLVLPTLWILLYDLFH